MDQPKSLKEIFVQEIDELPTDILMEMANVTSEDTGLPYTIHVYQVGHDKQLKHSPRIKVCTEKGKMTCSLMFFIQIDPPHELTGKPNSFPAKDLQNIITWISKNRDVLLQYWNAQGELASTKELYNHLKRYDAPDTPKT